MTSPILTSLKETIVRHNLVATKKLGQNFLLNLDITRRIARIAGDVSDASVIEIGPGPGGLTRGLLEQAPKKLIVIERDNRCMPIMEELQEAYPGKLEIIQADALTVKLQDLTSDPIKVVANLPYNIATVLLINWLHDLHRIRSMTLMFQKEVALRLIAKPRTKDYGRLSVITQFLTTAQKVMDLPPGAFSPPPKVTSSVVHLIPKELSAEDRALLPTLEKITHAAFGQRRKMIRGSLDGVVPMSILEELNIPGTARAEELTIAQFITMARSLYNRESR